MTIGASASLQEAGSPHLGTAPYLGFDTLYYLVDIPMTIPEEDTHGKQFKSLFLPDIPHFWDTVYGFLDKANKHHTLGKKSVVMCLSNTSDRRLICNKGGEGLVKAEVFQRTRTSSSKGTLPAFTQKNGGKFPNPGWKRDKKGEKLLREKGHLARDINLALQANETLRAKWIADITAYRAGFRRGTWNPALGRIPKGGIRSGENWLRVQGVPHPVEGEAFYDRDDVEEGEEEVL